MTGDIQERLKEAFTAQAGTTQPHHGAYTENLRRLRRSRIRRRIVTPAMSVVSVAAATVAVAATPLALTGLKHHDSKVTSGNTGPLHDPLKLADPATVVQINGQVPGGATFRADVLGTDGTILGRTPDNAVWQATPTAATPHSLGILAQGGLSFDGGVITWIEPNSTDLKCRTAHGATHVASAMPPAPGADPAAQVWSSGGVIAGKDMMWEPFVSQGCTARGGRVIPTPAGSIMMGDAVALNDKLLFVVEPANDKVIREVNAQTGRVVDVRPLPPGVRVHTMDVQNQEWWAAANSQTFAWAADGTFRVTDLQTWKHTVKPLPKELIKPFRGGRTTVTAGNHVVVYSTVSPSGNGESVLYDTWTRRTVRWHGDAYASGDWLLWRHGTGYRLARVP